MITWRDWELHLLLPMHESVGFNKVNACWVPKILADRFWWPQRLVLEELRKERSNFLNRTAAIDETWVFHFKPWFEKNHWFCRIKVVIARMKICDITKEYKAQNPDNHTKHVSTIFWRIQSPMKTNNYKVWRVKAELSTTKFLCRLLVKVEKDFKNKKSSRQMVWSKMYD